jgi:hypothetical protein
MIEKQPLFAHRVRKVPKQFSWLDHRLVRDRYIEHCTHPAAALYLFLVTVADERGLSYYSDPSLMKRLSMDPNTLAAARQNLIRIGLIAYQKPLYQVLALDPEPVIATSTARSSLDQPLSLAQIFKRMAGDIS